MQSASPLRFLEFDTVEDADGACVFDAMASVPAARWPALLAEVETVLGWAHREFPGARAPLDEGGEWDYQLDGAQEWRCPVELAHDERSGRVSAAPGSPGAPRHAASLSITGTAMFSRAFAAYLAGA